jgi:hypothetical protein
VPAAAKRARTSGRSRRLPSTSDMRAMMAGGVPPGFMMGPPPPEFLAMLSGLGPGGVLPAHALLDAYRWAWAPAAWPCSGN